MSLTQMRERLREMAARLRHAVPMHAPLDLAEAAQHCIVRLELLATELQLSHGDDPEALLQTANGILVEVSRFAAR